MEEIVLCCVECDAECDESVGGRPGNLRRPEGVEGAGSAGAMGESQGRRVGRPPTETWAHKAPKLVRTCRPFVETSIETGAADGIRRPRWKVRAAAAVDWLRSSSPCSTRRLTSSSGGNFFSSRGLVPRLSFVFKTPSLLTRAQAFALYILPSFTSCPASPVVLSCTSCSSPLRACGV